MIYSCFNERAGHYEYFEDDRGHAMNGDLPVPALSGRQAGKVGVPARDAGRQLPPGAKLVGAGWEARGMIVRCKGTGMRGLQGLGGPAEGAAPLVRFAFIGGGALLGVWYEQSRGADGATVFGGALAGGLLGSLLVYLAEGFS